MSMVARIALGIAFLAVLAVVGVIFFVLPQLGGPPGAEPSTTVASAPSAPEAPAPSPAPPLAAAPPPPPAPVQTAEAPAPAVPLPPPAPSLPSPAPEAPAPSAAAPSTADAPSAAPSASSVAASPSPPPESSLAPAPSPAPAASAFNTPEPAAAPPDAGYPPPSQSAMASPPGNPGPAPVAAPPEAPAAPALLNASEDLTTTAPTPVYGGPAAEGPVLRTLKPGTAVHIVARTADGKWGWLKTPGSEPAFVQMSLLSAAPVMPESIYGRAQVVTTATLLVNGQKIQLFGLQGEGGVYAEQMRAQLETQGNLLACHRHDTQYVCTLPGGVDIGRMALYNGAARPSANAPFDYQQQTASARAAGRGVWGR